MKNLIFSAILLFAFYTLPAQNIDDWVNSKKAVLYEKVYLHIDRELYSPRDTIWFKAYLVSGMTNKLIAGYKNIYVQLVSPEGKIIANRMLLSLNGETPGDISLPDSVADGQYTVRATTRYLENFGEEGFFHKQVWILSPKNSAGNDLSPNPVEQKIDVMFFPEGGNLVSEALNNIAFKAVDQSGKGIDASGRVTDESGNEVATFRTSFLGMGKFMLMPGEGKSYTATIDGFPGFLYHFENIKPEGIAISFRDEGENILITLSRNIKQSDEQTFYLAAIHKGVVLFYKTITLTGFQQAVKVPKNLFAQGISKISLLGPAFNIVAERLVFISDGQPNPVGLALNKEEFSTREKVELSVESFINTADTILSSLSIAVVNDNYLSPALNSQNILSYLLLDSELKGAIESPSLYFSDSGNLSPDEKLDLLMMVQGWRSYNWDEIPQLAPADLAGWEDVGLTVSGTVKKLLRDKPVVGGEVVLGPFSRNLLFEEATTDSVGRFRFDRLYLKDSAQIILNAKNENDRPNTEIFPDPLSTPPVFAPYDTIRKTVAGIGVPAKFYRENYFRKSAENEFNPEKGNILLGEVDVYAAKRKKDDGHVRLYSEPDRSLQVTEDDYTYSDIFDYLSSRAAGLVVDGTSVSIRGSSGAPLYILDGVKVESTFFESMIVSLHMQDIDKIEILNSGANMAMFGSQGANGIIAIYTKKGDNTAIFERYVKGRIIIRTNGFHRPNEFYSPKYMLENIANEKPDYRPTLFWSPSVAVINGKAAAEFFTCDNLANYVVFVEGISKNGKIISGVKQFSVTGFNPAAEK